MQEGVIRSTSYSESQLDPGLLRKLKRFVAKNNVNPDSASRIFRQEINEIIFAREIMLPAGIFVKGLGAFEAIVKYMRENLGMGFNEISEKTGRSMKTVWSAYNKARSKQKSLFRTEASEMRIPLEILKEKRLGVQENIVMYLKDSLSMSYHEIAVALNRNDRTVWTAYKRAENKTAK